jgi:hypothetical protein
MKILIGVTAAIIVAVVGVLFFAKQSHDSASLVIDTANKAAGTGFLGDLLDGQRSLICNYATAESDGVSQEGTLYYDAAGERFQVRNIMRDESGIYNSGVINDGNTVYTWAESPDGVIAFKVPAENPELDASGDATVETAGAEVLEDAQAFAAEVDYECVDWTVDESAFTPPSNVAFKTPQELFESMMGGMALPEAR